MDNVDDHSTTDGEVMSPSLLSASHAEDLCSPAVRLQLDTVPWVYGVLVAIFLMRAGGGCGVLAICIVVIFVWRSLVGDDFVDPTRAVMITVFVGCGLVALGLLLLCLLTGVAS